MILEKEALDIAALACEQYGIFWDAATAQAELWEYQRRRVWNVSTGIRPVHWTEQEMDNFHQLVLVDAETGEFLGQRTMRGLTPPAHLQQRKEERLAKERKESKVNAT